MIGYIYMTTNSVNTKIYVGKRQKPYFERGYKGSGKLLKLAFAKYGKDAFTTIPIQTCDTVEELCEAEKMWIEHFKKRGYTLYNIADGGKGGNNVIWAELPSERRKEINEKNRQSHLGKKKPPFSLEHREKLKATRRKFKPLSEIEHEKVSKREHLKPIVQIDKATGSVIRKWNNWGEAGEMFRSEHGRYAYAHISDCCKGMRKSAYGFRWAFAEGFEI